jgi:hypothetical protein
MRTPVETDLDLSVRDFHVGRNIDQIPEHPGRKVAGFDRNRWPLSAGISGHFGPESLAGFDRNTHLLRQWRHLQIKLVTECQNLIELTIFNTQYIIYRTIVQAQNNRIICLCPYSFSLLITTMKIIAGG